VIPPECYIGIDVGSISLNSVVVSPSREILFETTVRHQGKPIEAASRILTTVFEKFEQESIANISVTGSAGKLIAELLNANFVNEIIAQARSVAYLFPAVRSVIEIGGEDAKLIRLRNTEGPDVLDIEDFEMNSVCSAGTGSFLDQQAFRLGVDISEFSRLSLLSETPPRLAGRCSVFAKSDMIHLQQIGMPVHDIVAGLCFALARNFVSVLGGGREIEKPVIFQGGVSENFGIRRAFREILGLAEDELIIPPHFLSMGAIGAVYKTLEDPAEEILAYQGIDRLREYAEAPPPPRKGLRSPLKRPPARLTLSPETLCLPPEAGKIKCYLGVDVGSVSTNLVLMDEQKRVIAKEYLRTRSRPIEAVMEGLRKIHEKVGEHVEVMGVGSTGSGRYMIGKLIGADVIRNEITTQTAAAIHTDPSVDTIFEIGGQDSKYIRIEDGVIIDFNMNHACAAGTGSFLEEQAENLGIDIKSEFSQLAFKSDNPVPLAEKCTVFIESDLIHHQQRGTGKEDLIAGLSYAIVQNYIHKVVKTGTIGDQIFFQGGVAFNDAVVASFEAVTGKKIIVPEHHEVTGAIGAALIAQQESTAKETHFRGFELAKRAYEIQKFQCPDCENNCEINKVILENEEPLFFGSRCGKYDVTKEKVTNHLPDLFADREDFLLNTYSQKDPGPVAGERRRIGIPRTLMMFELFPTFKAFFTELGFDVVLSDKTNEEIIKTGTEKVPAEFCFPVKVAFGHVHNLIEKGVDAIFLPSIRSLKKVDTEQAHSWVCVWIQAIPYTVKSVINFEKEGIQILSPVIWFDLPEDRVKKTFIDLGKELGKSKTQVLRALDTALIVQQSFVDRCLARGEEALKQLGEDEFAIVIVSRPYNGNDSRISLNIPKKLRQLGVMAIPMDFLPLDSIRIPLSEETINWRNGQRIVKAAKIIREDPRLFPIFITNFNCGPDSFILHYFREHMGGKPFLELEVDEHSSDTGAITRCEAFIDSLKNYQTKRRTPAVQRRVDRAITRDLEVYIPQSDAINSLAVTWQAAHKAYGMKLNLFPPSTRETLEYARQFTSGKECYPYQLIIGDTVKLIQDPTVDNGNLAIVIPSTPGACRLVGYPKGIRNVLDRLGCEHVPIHPVTKRFKELQHLHKPYSDIEQLVYHANTCREVVLKKVREIRPYEVNKGETNAVYEALSGELCGLTERKGPFVPFLKKARDKLRNIPTRDDGSKPVIAVVGEIYVRLTPFANNQLEHEIERLGGEALFVPLREELFFRNYFQYHWARMNRSYKDALRWFAIDKGMRFFERRYEKAFNGDFRNRSDSQTVSELQALAAPYMDSNFWGITVASIGTLAEGIEKEMYDGVISIGPFSCMPTTVVHALSKMVQDTKGRFPYLLYACEGLEQTNITTRLEAFMYQAKEHWRRRYAA